MTELNRHQIAQRGVEAALVLENEAFKDAMQGLRTSVVEEWKKCPIRDKEGQLLLLQLAKLTDKFEGMLIGMVEGGKYATHQIKIDDLRNESKSRKLLRRVTG